MHAVKGIQYDTQGKDYSSIHACVQQSYNIRKTLYIYITLHHLAVSQVWYAADATGVGRCSSLRKWWDTLSQLGPLFGYHPNGFKTYLVVKDRYIAAPKRAFAGTCFAVTTDGH